MTKIDTRCTQCGTKNENDVHPQALKRGSGRKHGTENVRCTTCDAVTVQNRCGASVPTAGK